MSQSQESVRVPVHELCSFVVNVLKAHGVPEEDADVVSSCLLTANRSGVDSHGVVRLAHYISRLKSGSINARPQLKFYPRSSALGYVDGDDGLGHVVGDYATSHVLKLAARNGIGAVSVGNSSHFGMAAHYSLRMAASGFVGLCMTPSDKLLVPFGASVPFFGSNPICFAFPTGGIPLVLDMATTTVAYGKIKLAEVEGQSIPGDWGVDSAGQSTTVPEQVVGLHAAAGPKGSGIAMVIDILCSVLAGMPFGPHISPMYQDKDVPRKLGHFFVAIDIGRFLPIIAFEEMLGNLVSELTALTPASGFDRVCFPGQLEGERRRERDRLGIPVDRGLAVELSQLGMSCGVLSPFSF